MRISAVMLAATFAMTGLGAFAGETVGVEQTTKLPLPTAGTPVVLNAAPDMSEPVPVCSSKAVMTMYTPRTGSVSGAVSWYANRLAGFKHVHGFGSGRSQDSFYNSTGTLIVSITGSPAAEGQDTKVYAVTYATVQPGVSEAVIAGMNIQKMVCH